MVMAMASSVYDTSLRVNQGQSIKYRKLEFQQNVWIFSKQQRLVMIEIFRNSDILQVADYFVWTETPILIIDFRSEFRAISVSRMNTRNANRLLLLISRFNHPYRFYHPLKAVFVADNKSYKIRRATASSFCSNQVASGRRRNLKAKRAKAPSETKTIKQFFLLQFKFTARLTHKSEKKSGWAYEKKKLLLIQRTTRLSGSPTPKTSEKKLQQKQLNTRN